MEWPKFDDSELLDITEFMQRLDLYKFDRRGGVRPVVYLFSFDHKKALMDRFELTQEGLDTLFGKCLCRVMRGQHPLTLVEGGVFTTLLPDMSETMNPTFERRFLNNMNQIALEFKVGPHLFSTSIGAAVQIRGESAREWMWRAGTALTAARRAGGNRQVTKNVDQKNSWIAKTCLRIHPWLIPPEFRMGVSICTNQSLH